MLFRAAEMRMKTSGSHAAGSPAAGGGRLLFLWRERHGWVQRCALRPRGVGGDGGAYGHRPGASVSSGRLWGGEGSVSPPPDRGGLSSTEPSPGQPGGQAPGASGPCGCLAPMPTRGGCPTFWEGWRVCQEAPTGAAKRRPARSPAAQPPTGARSGTQGALCLDHGAPSCTGCTSLGWGITRCCRAGHEGYPDLTAGPRCPKAPPRVAPGR